MRLTVLFLFFALTSWLGTAQEIPAIREPSSEFIIQRLEIRPSLTNLAPEIPNMGRFQIREVNFNTSNQRREVDIAAVMEQEERMRVRNIELAPPVQVPQAGNVAASRDDSFSITPRFYNESFSPELQTRGTRNSVYRNAAEGTGAHYLNSHNPFLRARYYRPGYGYYYR